MPDEESPKKVEESDAPEPIKNPLKETEAREFIKEEVEQDLGRRAKWFFTIFGAANLVALVGVWFAVQNAAQNAATQEASRIVHEAIDPMTKTVGETFTNSLKEYLQAYSDLEQRRKRIDASVSSGEGDLKQLKASLSDTEATIKDLNQSVSADVISVTTLLDGVKKVSSDLEKLKDVAANLEKIKDIPTTQLASIISQLSTEGSALVPKLDQMFSELGHAYEYGVKSADSDPLANIFKQNFQAFTDALAQIERDGAPIIVDQSGSEKWALDDTTKALIEKFIKGGHVNGKATTSKDLFPNFGSIELPKGSDVVATWGVPYGGTSRRTYTIVKDTSDPSKLQVNFSAPGKDTGEVTVYVLYRTPLHLASNK